MNGLLDDFFGTGNEIKPAEMDPPMQALLDNWQATIRSGGVGFLPRRTAQRTYWYAFAPSPRQRRELLDLLDAWIGPTYSDLAVSRGELDLSDPFDAALTPPEARPLRFEVLPRVAPHSAPAKEAVRNALATLSRLANERPPSQFDAMRTTVEILDDLGHAIAARDRGLADACMAELEQSADLDEANLAFLRLRLFAGMKDWAAMFADPAFDQVLSMRRPLRVTRVIQSGLYCDRFQESDRPGGEAELRATAELLESPLRDLYTGAPPGNRAEAVIELICRLLTTRSADDSAVEELIGVASEIETGLDEQFRRIVEAFVPPGTTSTPDPEVAAAQAGASPTAQVASLMLQGEFSACIELGVASEPSVEAGRALVYAARQLSSSEWAAMVVDYLVTNDLKGAVAATTPMLRADVEWLESICDESTIRGWEEWLSSLASEEAALMTSTSDVMQLWEPLPAEKLVPLLIHASESTLARLGESGGQFFAAHGYLLGSPHAAEVTLRLLAAMAISGKASAGVRVQTLALSESISAVAAPQSTFEEFMEWTAEIVEANAAATTVSWVCDIVQTLTSIPAPKSKEAMLAFYYQAIQALRPFRTALDATDLEALGVVAAELGTTLPADFSALRARFNEEDGGAAFGYLAGKTVVLHSLTESAIIRASQVLKNLVPTSDVRTNSEHGGSPQLAQLSANADVFVVVTAAAKHAATLFIASHRKGRPTVLVNSRGSSAILRALADFNL